MEIKVAIFEDNKSLLESLKQLINGADGMTCAGAFADANKTSPQYSIGKSRCCNDGY